MTAIPSSQSLAAANLDSLERLAIALGLFFAQKTAILPDTSAAFEAVTFRVRERAGVDPENPEAMLITSTIEFECYFSLQSDAALEGGILLENIEPFFTLDAPTFPVSPASLLDAPALPTIPAELANAEQLMVWALLTLNASTYPENQDFIQIAPTYGDNELKISFQFPLDSEALSLNSYQYIAASKRIVNDYLALDTGAVAQIGLDAYQVAVAEGFLGTRAEWVASLVGAVGPAGADGISAYQVAVAGGFVGDEAAWLASLVGPAGADGADGAPGADSIVPGPAGADGADGISAYQVAVAGGFVGDEAAWLASLVGPAGADGADGAPGIDGTGMAWRGPWDSVTNYAQFDGVEYLGSTYIANAPSLNKLPGTDPEWDLMVAKGNTGSAGADGAGIVNDILTLPHVATPADPGAGNTAVYAKSDGKIYKLPTGGIEEEIGAGGASAYSDLTDVDTTGLTTGQTMIWNGTFWVPGSASGGREVLTADRTYYVRTDGSDSNDGLSNSAGGAFLTIQKAIDVAASLDLSIYNVIISVTNNITESVIAKKLTGAGSLIIKSTSGVIDWTGESGTHLLTIPAGVTNYKTQSIKLTSPDTILVSCYSGGSYYIGLNTNFGSTTSYQLYAVGGYIRAESDYTISGGGNCHFATRVGGIIDFTGITNVVTLTGTPAYSAFARAFDAGVILMGGATNTFSGSATGSRYKIERNSTCYVDNQGTSYFPGNAAGSVDASSIYK